MKNIKNQKKNIIVLFLIVWFIGYINTMKLVKKKEDEFKEQLQSMTNTVLYSAL